MSSWVSDTVVYGERDERAFLDRLTELNELHFRGCPAYASILGKVPRISSVEEAPFLHVGLFKRLRLITKGEGIVHGRIVRSSSTSGVASEITLDEESSRLQSLSSLRILEDFVGRETRPLLVLDGVASLRSREGLSARVLAAMSLKPFATEIFFVLKDASDAASLNEEQIRCALKQPGPLLVYGISWALWMAWANRTMPADIESDLRTRTITFVHSGGWKKLENARVDRADFERVLLTRAAPGSKVVDYYGLVEQVGMVYPMCEFGARHVPAWGDVLVRDPWTLAALPEGDGQLQLINTISRGAPYHNILTEDIGRLIPGPCPCGRRGRRFELIGRMPKAELRGCANV